MYENQTLAVPVSISLARHQMCRRQLSFSYDSLISIIFDEIEMCKHYVIHLEFSFHFWVALFYFLSIKYETKWEKQKHITTCIYHHISRNVHILFRRRPILRWNGLLFLNSICNFASHIPLYSNICNASTSIELFHSLDFKAYLKSLLNVLKGVYSLLDNAVKVYWDWWYRSKCDCYAV